MREQPELTPDTVLGQAAVSAYAARAGVGVATFPRSRPPVLTSDTAGAEIAGLIADQGPDKDAYRLRPAGLIPAL